ncbi:MAG: DUF2920 family protein [Syntrophomonas sp.]
MNDTVKLTLIPHIDIELHRNRQELIAYASLPELGVNSKTGLLINIEGLGGKVTGDGTDTELRSYLANTYNMIVVGISYFGIERGVSVRITDAFYNNINRIYGLGLKKEELEAAKDANEFYYCIAARLVQRGIMNLDPRCQPIMVTGQGEYQSWGLLPAIDGLQVVGELLQRYPVNHGRIIACGQGYGGYIAMLMGKFAPQTFAAIIDKGGHVKSELRHVVGGEVLEPDHIATVPVDNFPLDFSISLASDNPWTIEDEDSPYYFSDSHRQIRNLLAESHCVTSDTCYYIFHSEKDTIVPITEKQRLVEILLKFHPVEFQRIGEANLIRGPYQSLNNDLGISWEELLDLVKPNLCTKQESNTDFSLNNIYTFECGTFNYEFGYQSNGGLSVKRVRVI